MPPSRPAVPTPRIYDSMPTLLGAATKAGLDCGDYSKELKSSTTRFDCKNGTVLLFPNEQDATKWITTREWDPETTMNNNSTLSYGRWAILADVSTIMLLNETLPGLLISGPASTAVRYQIDCGENSYTDYRQAWTAEESFTAEFAESYWLDEPLDEGSLTLCDVEMEEGGTYTKAQLKAISAADYEEQEEIATLFGLCAATRNYYAQKNSELSEAQITEAKAMLLLCPDFPAKDRVTANMKTSQRIQKERTEGARFEDGSYRVGKEIKSGVYYIPKADGGCYWERLDKRGEIIDNNFINASTRVQVTIRSSDYTFSSESCGGEWRRA